MLSGQDCARPLLVRFSGTVLLMAAAAAASAPAAAQSPPVYSAMHWRMIGPTRGGRAARAVRSAQPAQRLLHRLR